MKKIFFLLVFAALLFCLAGCVEGESQSEEIRFYNVYSKFGSEIYVDADTGVMYLYQKGSYGGGLSVMVDSSGNPLIYEDFEKEAE